MIKEWQFFVSEFKKTDEPVINRPNWSRLTLMPDFFIGDNYMRRWWLIPRNPVLNVYLHCVSNDDDDRALHDHPAINISFVIKGVYREVMPDFSNQKTPYTRIYDAPKKTKTRGPGSIVYRRSHAAHRLEVVKGPVWTLWIRGPSIREWGFHCRQGWRSWKEFLSADDKGKVGRGCD